jgi:hypothetical protein
MQSSCFRCLKLGVGGPGEPPSITVWSSRDKRESLTNGNEKRTAIRGPKPYFRNPCKGTSFEDKAELECCDIAFAYRSVVAPHFLMIVKQIDTNCPAPYKRDRQTVSVRKSGIVVHVFMKNASVTF